MLKIKKAIATYTGGGIYEYCGKLEDGNWYLAWDEWESVLIVDSDPYESDDEYAYEEWQDKHMVCEIIEDEPMIDILTATIKAMHDGEEMNACDIELENRLKKYTEDRKNGNLKK